MPSTEKCSSDSRRPNLPVVQKLGEKLARNLRFQQPVAVLREHGRHPHRLIDAEADEPAVEQVVVQLLHQLRLRADRVERLQQQRPQQPLGRNRRPAGRRVDPLELRVERDQHIIDDAPDHAQRMLRRNTILQIHIGEQLARPRIRAPHPRLPRWMRHRNHIRSRLSGGEFFSGL